MRFRMIGGGGFWLPYLRVVVGCSASPQIQQYRVPEPGRVWVAISRIFGTFHLPLLA